MEQPRGPDGQYVSLEKYFEMLLGERIKAIYSELASGQKALEIQAKEYERRLDALNHAHKRAETIQGSFVSLEKYETRVEADGEARALALQRLDEKIANVNQTINDKLDDYVKKAEARQTEIEQAIATSKAVAEEAQRAAEAQGRKSKEQIEAQHRKTNRNMAFAGLALTIVITVVNWVGSGI